MMNVLAAVLCYEMVLVNPAISPIDYTIKANDCVQSVRENYRELNWSEKARKEFEEEHIKMEIYNHDGHENYEYLVEFDGRLFKMTSNEASSFINRNTKFTAVIVEDCMLLSWNGNNMISVILTDDPDDVNEYEYLAFEGTVIK